MAYTAVDEPEIFMVPRIYDGTGSSQTISCGFQPDMSWVKSRNNAYNNRLGDSVRGYTNVFITNTTIASATDATIFSGTTSDGVTVVSDYGSNATSNNYILWNWKAGTTTGIAGSPDITPTSYSFNQTSGFSIIAYTGNGSAGDTIPHGLGVAPTFIMVKRVDDTGSWICYHSMIDPAYVPEDYHILLESTAARVDSTGGWNDTAPTSTLITLGGDTNISTATYIAYCFTDVQGYSHAGAYEGNAAGPLVYTGFRPAFVMIKLSNGATANWTNRDNARDTFNATYNYIYPNLNNAGTDIGPPATSGSYAVDFLANGFKIRNTDDKLNTTGNSYIYAAFAYSPFCNSSNVPNNAR